MHIHPFVRVLLQVKFLLDVLPKEVVDVLVIDLQVRSVDQVLHVLAGVNSLNERIVKMIFLS